MSILRRSMGSGAISIKSERKKSPRASNDTSPATSPPEHSTPVTSPRRISLFSRSVSPEKDRDRDKDKTKLNENLLPQVVLQAAEKGDLASLQKLTKPTLGTRRNYFEHVTTKGKTILHIACESGHKDVVDWMLQSQDKLEALEQGDLTFYTPLSLAIKNGHFEIAQELIKSGALVNTSSKGITYSHPFSLFIQACSEQFPSSKSIQQLFDVFIKHNLHLDSTDLNRDTYLHQATLLQAHVVVDLLLRNGAKVNAQNQFGQTPLHYILKKIPRNIFQHNSDSEVIGILTSLISYGADPYNHKTEQGSCIDLIKLTQKGRDQEYYLLWLVKGLQGLPNTILLQIFSYLSPTSKEIVNLLNVSVVCKKLRDLTKEDSLWKPIWDSSAISLLRKNRTKSGLLYSDLIADYFNSDLLYYITSPPASSPTPDQKSNTTTSTDVIERYRIMFVGDEGTGKSRFLFKFLNTPYMAFPAKEDESGVKHKLIQLPGRQIQIKITEQSLRRGRPSNYRISPYRGIDVFLVFCSLEKKASFDRVKQWLTEVSRFHAEPDSKDEGVFLIVGTRDVGKREVGRKDVEQLIRQTGKRFVETTEDGHNVFLAMMMAIEDLSRKRKVRKKGRAEAETLMYIW